MGQEMCALDRAAWGGITACNPFDPLPQQFKGDYLALRMHFYYNPEKLPPIDNQPRACGRFKGRNSRNRTEMPRSERFLIEFI